jgi:hypothetical protein
MQQKCVWCLFIYIDDCDVIDLYLPVNNRDVEGVIYTRLCSQLKAEILFT